MMDAQETRRLLELAARAAGYDVSKRLLWRPHEDDGDALRLAVALRLSVVLSLRGEAMAMNHDFSVSVTEPAGDDHCATTRLAVLRAAATVGEQMENRQS